MQKLSTFDNWLICFDHGLKAIIDQPISQRPNPAQNVPDMVLDSNEQKESSARMRVNHTGEVCAQGIYLGQSLMTRELETRTVLLHAATEEIDHLTWCYERLNELGSHPSRLNFFWYSSSFLIGILFGLLPTKFNLGFVAETEQQVTQHLENHLQSLPTKDLRSRAIVEHMQIDEKAHGAHAIKSGGETLPAIIKLAMRAMAKVMTTVAYWF
jgi:ubiquinone biosynthesis monooxygenase Coq7